ncbi:transcriptional regulator with XRE-family HTH domain [Aminobacter aminovorans]|uniref:Transcriptional regulator with XRE-family HTH domain n=1 Tax=Aminobacter aminovorans TaxID=83263 RepID=A0ABR6H2J9_AMIAI|nr:transcriptional regulator with XRE-family HTH domain [Aminobacter aminovorans]
MSELAAVADISISMLSKVEHGTISPSLKTLLGLSRSLGVPLSRLFSRFQNETSGPHLHGDGPFRLPARRSDIAARSCRE